MNKEHTAETIEYIKISEYETLKDFEIDLLESRANLYWEKGNLNLAIADFEKLLQISDQFYHNHYIEIINEIKQQMGE